MNLSALSYALALFIVLLGVFGQWWGNEAQHLWRLTRSTSPLPAQE